MTGKALYGADMNLPGMLHAKVLRSPHAHARIISIDTSKAEAHPEVRAVVTSKDFPEPPTEPRVLTSGPAVNIKHLSNNVLAGDRVLYKGHAIAAIAANSAHAAEEALALIDVEYEVLPVVTDVESAMAPGAPLLHDEYKNNVASHNQLKIGDPDKGFQEADYGSLHYFLFRSAAVYGADGISDQEHQGHDVHRPDGRRPVGGNTHRHNGRAGAIPLLH